MDVKRDFVLQVELTGKPSPDQLLEAITLLRKEAKSEFGDGFVERVDLIGNPPFGAPKEFVDQHPVIIFRAFPPKTLP